jgi:hypothetical protein
MRSLAMGVAEVLRATEGLLATDEWFTKKSKSCNDFWVGVLGIYLYEEGMRMGRN